MIDPEAIEKQIRAADHPERKDLENLRTLLTSDWFQRCMKPAIEHLDGSSRALERANLDTQEGVSSALKRQGEIHGLRLTLQTLADAANEVKDNDNG